MDNFICWETRGLDNNGVIRAKALYYSKKEAEEFAVALITEGSYLQIKILPLYEKEDQ